MKILRVPLLIEDSVWQCIEMRENKTKKQKQANKPHLSSKKALCSTIHYPQLICIALLLLLDLKSRPQCLHSTAHPDEFFITDHFQSVFFFFLIHWHYNINPDHQPSQPSGRRKYLGTPIAAMQDSKLRLQHRFTFASKKEGTTHFVPLLLFHMVGIPTEYFHIVLMISQIGKVNPHPWNNQQKCALSLITSICCHIVIFATDNEIRLEFIRYSYE